MSDTVKCADCGRFIADEELAAAQFHFVPLNEFGPEEGEWTCSRCLTADRERQAARG